MEFFVCNKFDEIFFLDERLNGSKFWVFEGFAKDVISQEDRPNISVKFSCEYIPDISGTHEFEIFGVPGGPFGIKGGASAELTSDLS